MLKLVLLLVSFYQVLSVDVRSLGLLSIPIKQTVVTNNPGPLTILLDSIKGPAKFNTSIPTEFMASAKVNFSRYSNDFSYELYLSGPGGFRWTLDMNDGGSHEVTQTTVSTLPGGNTIMFPAVGTYSISLAIFLSYERIYQISTDQLAQRGLWHEVQVVDILKSSPPLSRLLWLSPQDGGCTSTHCVPLSETPKHRGNISISTGAFSYTVWFIPRTAPTIYWYFLNGYATNLTVNFEDLSYFIGALRGTGYYNDQPQASFGQALPMPQGEYDIAVSTYSYTLIAQWRNYYSPGALQNLGATHRVTISTPTTDTTPPTCTGALLSTAEYTVGYEAPKLDITCTDVGGTGVDRVGVIYNYAPASTSTYEHPRQFLFELPSNWMFFKHDYATGTYTIAGVFAVDHAGNAVLYGSCSPSVLPDGMGSLDLTISLCGADRGHAPNDALNPNSNVAIIAGAAGGGGFLLLLLLIFLGCRYWRKNKKSSSSDFHSSRGQIQSLDYDAPLPATRSARGGTQELTDSPPAPNRKNRSDTIESDAPPPMPPVRSLSRTGAGGSSQQQMSPPVRVLTRSASNSGTREPPRPPSRQRTASGDTDSPSNSMRAPSSRAGGRGGTESPSGSMRMPPATSSMRAASGAGSGSMRRGSGEPPPPPPLTAAPHAPPRLNRSASGADRDGPPSPPRRLKTAVV